MNSDTNTALTLLLRYPPLSSDSKPLSLLFDARALRTSPTAEIGASIIQSRTSRRPSTIDRPLTPDHRARSPFAYSASSPAGLETLLSDAARGVLSRSERWGLNQAVRDVVGEVRRGVQRGITASASGSTSPAPGPRYRRHGSHSKSKSETHSAIAASAFRRMNELEERNRKLASMMEGAVTDLWGVHERLAEKSDAQDDKERKKEIESLSAAVARLQFVQAFLKDVTLPLPEEPTQQDNSKEEIPMVPDNITESMSIGHQVKRKDNNSSTRSRSTSKDPIQPSHPPRSTTPLLYPNFTIQSQPPTHSKNISTSPHTKASLVAPQPKRSSAISLTHNDPPPPASITIVPPPVPSSPTPSPNPRPRLTESSFSWMLTADANGNSFSRATPFTPHEKRNQATSTSVNNAVKAKAGKGFLFGEDSDGEIAELDIRRGSGSSTKAKDTLREDERRKSLEDVKEIDLENI